MYGPHLSMVAIFANDLVFRERERDGVLSFSDTLQSAYFKQSLAPAGAKDDKDIVIPSWNPLQHLLVTCGPQAYAA